jgi:hypothetical protein
LKRVSYIIVLLNNIKEEESMISGILLILFLCAVEWLGAHIALEANPQAKREYYNNNDPFKTLFM